MKEERDHLNIVDEAADQLKLKPSTMRKKILRGEVDIVRVSARAIRIPQSWIDRVIRDGFQKAKVIK